MEKKDLKKLCKLIRYDILTSTTAAGSGHPTSSLSAVELMTTLFFGGFLRYDLKNPQNIFNDRVIFSKGHAAPLLYSLYHAADAISYEELLTLRKFNSNLEGHPTPRFKYVDVATGSLGQGLSLGLGMAMGMRLKIQNLPRLPKVWVLLGDSEMAEGQVWEALEITSYYRLNNLVGIIDVNRLGQNGETMYGWDLKTYQKRIEGFGWETILIEDGHNLKLVNQAFKKVLSSAKKRPVMLIAKTIKGKGISFLEDKDGWHGKALNNEELKTALKESGKVDLKIRGTIQSPNFQTNPNEEKLIAINNRLRGLAAGGEAGRGSVDAQVRRYSPPDEQRWEGKPSQNLPQLMATREAFGDALLDLGKKNNDIVVFDAEVGNSTYENKFAQDFPERFFQLYIAEENVVSAALGFSKIGFTPFLSTFAAFLTRTHDQIRMAEYSNPNLKIVGSHAGVSIGADGPSQMGLEDIAMMRSVLNSVVFYPSDAISCGKLTEIMAKNNGLFYLRTTRAETPIIYDQKEKFEIGGLKILRQSEKDKAIIIGAGITLHEALKAHAELKKQGILTTVVDLYSVKPIDEKTLKKLVQKTRNIIVVEDHYPSGGIGEAVLSVLSSNFDSRVSSFIHLSVRKLPRSGSSEELLHFEKIDSAAISEAAKTF